MSRRSPGTVPGIDSSAAPGPAAARERTDEAPGVGVLRCTQHGGGGARLDDPAGVQHGDAVADVVDHLEVVRDQQDSEPELVLQVEDQLQDLLGAP